MRMILTNNQGELIIFHANSMSLYKYFEIIH